LQLGASKARAVAMPFLRELRGSVGLRAFKRDDVSTQSDPADSLASKKPKAQFKQYRESDGKFYFKLIDADGRVVLQSNAHDSPRDAGQLIARLKRESAAVLECVEDRVLKLGAEVVGTLAEDAMEVDDVANALASMIEADA
jgi:tryptophanyl-tRNA synthetase